MKSNSILLLALCVSLSFAGASNVHPTGMFSDMFYSDESGDIGGTEIFIVLGDDNYWVVYQEAEGAPTKPIIVKAEITANQIKFILPKNELHEELIFTGKITEKALIGKFEGRDEKLKLPRKKSYWE